jgi:hypothetical protein
MIRTLAALLIAAVSAVAIAQAPANPPVRAAPWRKSKART